MGDFSLDYGGGADALGASAVAPAQSQCPLMGLLKSAAPGAIGGAVSALGSLLTQRSQNKQEEKMAKIDRTAPGFEDLGKGAGSFGSEMQSSSPASPALSLAGLKMRRR